MTVWVLLSVFWGIDRYEPHVFVAQSQESCERLAESESKMKHTVAVCYPVVVPKLKDQESNEH